MQNYIAKHVWAILKIRQNFKELIRFKDINLKVTFRCPHKNSRFKDLVY